MVSKTLLEHLVAKAIYHAEGGLTDEDFETILGEPRRTWDKLAEWERDGYLAQAKAAMEVVDRHFNRVEP